MNDEIKEILDNMKEISSFEYTTDWFELNYEDTKILLDYITNLQQLEQEHKKINGELRERIAYLEIALQNIQEDYDRRIKEIDVLKKKLDRKYYKNECKRLEQENERLKEQANENKVIVEYAIKPSFTTRKLKELKQENERLKEQTKKDNHILGCNFASKDKYKQRYEDYKSRCEKAISKIKLLGKYDGECCTRNFKMMSADFNNLLNILQNGSEENE